MSNSKANRWTAAELERLRSLLDAGKTAREIAIELDRTPLAIYGQVQRIYRKRYPAKPRRDPGDRD
jgi:DNA-binding CsgD family transcriptional regulator